ncbi:hypothetical protein SEA_SPEEDDEMON_1310 [Gordonia phage SpeedDemon]|nr:hypothetical protein SEA_SPEEDDEMON_1310 [Gordonia phage SpeedDemon]
MAQSEQATSLLPAEVRLSIDLALARRDVELERERVDRLLASDRKLYELRDWLRILHDNQAGHTEFFRHACFLIFGEYNGVTAEEAYRDDGSWIYDD